MMKALAPTIGASVELDEKLLEAVYAGISINKLPKVPKDSVNWFKVGPNGDAYEFAIDSNSIKQAFIDAGWHEPQELEYKTVYTPSPKLNPDWMVKNNINYDTITDVSMLPPREEYEAAKKVAGIDHA